MTRNGPSPPPPASLRDDAPTGAPPLLAALDEDSRTVVAERVRRADTFRARLAGLLGRDRVEEDEELWIEPCRAIRTVGMRCAIDAVFLDAAGRVVALVEELGPWRMTRRVRGARSVLALPAGRARASRLLVGHRIDFVQPSDGTAAEADA